MEQIIPLGDFSLNFGGSMNASSEKDSSMKKAHDELEKKMNDHLEDVKKSFLREKRNILVSNFNDIFNLQMERKTALEAKDILITELKSKVKKLQQELDKKEGINDDDHYSDALFPDEDDEERKNSTVGQVSLQWHYFWSISNAATLVTIFEIYHGDGPGIVTKVICIFNAWLNLFIHHSQFAHVLWFATTNFFANRKRCNNAQQKICQYAWRWRRGDWNASPK